MVPHADPLHPVPATVQLTAVFDVFVTVAVNGCVAPVSNWTLFGEMVTATPATIVTVALPDLVGSATDVAVTVTCAGLGTVEGAV